MREGSPGTEAPRLRLLPSWVTVEEVRALQPTRAGDPRPALLLGVDEHSLAPVTLDVHSEPHLLLFGDGGSGKSAALRTYLHEVRRSRGPEQAQVVVVDYRRALLGEVPDDQLLHYLTSSAQAVPALAELAAYLTKRLPGPDATPEQLRNRSWWTGADVFVVVDDYDLVATSHGSPLEPLVELMPQAVDVGLHVGPRAPQRRRSPCAVRARRPGHA